MHTYSTDNKLRPKIIGFIGIASYVFLQGISGIVTELNQSLSLGIDLSVPAAGAVFVVMYLSFEKKLWKNKWLRKFGIVKSPNLAGEWTGTIDSVYEPGDQDQEIAVRIRQSWRKLSIELDGPSSSSRSVGATLLTDQGKPQLVYYYLNEPDYDAPDTMGIHYGTASLTYHESEQSTESPVLDGFYYTTPDRKSHGKIRLNQ